MAIQNISNLPISASFQNILQRSGSVIGTATGTQIDELTISASYATNASTADLATSATTATSASFATTASFALNVPTVDTGSLLQTASISDATITFEKADASTFDLTVNNVVSASHALNADDAISASFTTTASYATKAETADSATFATSATSASHAVQSDNATSASFAISASYAANAAATLDTGSLLTTASISDATITFEKGDASTFAITVDNVDTASVAISSSHALNADSAISASHALQADASQDVDDLIIPVKNDFGATIAKGTPVYAKGVLGEQILIAPASASDATRMPAIAILNEELTSSAGGEAIVSGRIKNVNTLGFIAGRTVYVGADGGYTQTKPTGSNLIQNLGVVGKVNATEGEGVIIGSGRSNDVPNITENYLWVGNSDQVATPTDKGALTVGTASLALDVISTANLNVTTISASSANFQSASIGYLESVTGSAKIIGDAFIILNNNLPAERYAGVVVQDSGSTNTTASFEWDGQTNDWFYHYEGDDPTDFSIAMFGPEYTTKGSPVYPSNNTILKGDGGHHVNDSNITDDGTTIVLGSNSEVTGSLGVTGTITGTLSGQASTAISASHAVQADSSLTATTASYVAASNVDGTVATATSASHALNADDAISSSYATSASIADFEKNLNSNSGSIQLWQGSKTEYDAISGSASNNILYFVIGE